MDMPSSTPLDVPVPLAAPIQGQADWRNYRCFRLSNGVTCCVVHDRESKTTAAACTVNVGAAADPQSLSGLAHFTEHAGKLQNPSETLENEARIVYPSLLRQ